MELVAPRRGPEACGATSTSLGIKETSGGYAETGESRLSMRNLAGPNLHTRIEAIVGSDSANGLPASGSHLQAVLVISVGSRGGAA